MDPALERLYMEEVLHLHSLWHRGPPGNPNPNLTLRPATGTAFKKEAKNKKKSKSKSKSKSKWEKKQQQQQQQQGSAAASDQPPANPPAKEGEWPCDSPPEKDVAPATWADLSPTPAATQTRPPSSAEEQARAAADRAQQRGLKACKDFFAKKDGSDDGEEEEDSMDEDEEVGEEDFKFFLGLFESVGELREYYEKNREKGDFSCLVCGAIGVKKWKRFGDCVGLIQHSNSISKTKRREAHRAFARAVCRVLGWDIKRLPNIVLDLGNSLGQSLAKADNPQEDMQKEDISAEVEGISNEVAADAGADKVDLMDCAAKEIEALPAEKLQKVGETDEKENDEEPMDCIETKRITELPNEDVIDKKEKLCREIGNHGENNDGLDE